MRKKSRKILRASYDRESDFDKFILRVMDNRILIFFVREKLSKVYDNFGEKTLEEILTKFKNEKVKLDSEIVNKLAKDWDNLKHYPLEWSIELVKSS